MTTKSRHHRDNYFTEFVLQNTERFIRDARRDLKDIDFDTFVVRGMSGAIAGGMLARSMKKNLFVVRKETDDSHDGKRPFGTMGERWVFLDDFISSGETFWKTFSVVKSCYQSGRNGLGLFGTWDYRNPRGGRWVPDAEPTYVGAYLYRDGWHTTEDTMRYVGMGMAGDFE